MKNCVAADSPIDKQENLSYNYNNITIIVLDHFVDMILTK